jgi:hypothetical protein
MLTMPVAMTLEAAGVLYGFVKPEAGFQVVKK